MSNEIEFFLVLDTDTFSLLKNETFNEPTTCWISYASIAKSLNTVRSHHQRHTANHTTKDESRFYAESSLFERKLLGKNSFRFSFISYFLETYSFQHFSTDMVSRRPAIDMAAATLIRFRQISV